MLSPVPEPRVVTVVVRIAALVTATAFAVGVVGGVVLALATGAVNHLAH